MEAEAELRRLNEQVAAQRRALPAGGLIRADYVFESAADSGEAFDTYVRAYQARGAMADYRANGEDVAQDTVDARVKIAGPVMSLWGAEFYAVRKMFEMSKVWAEMASNLVTHAIPQAGHLPPEEQPDVVNRLLMDFLGGLAGLSPQGELRERFRRLRRLSLWSY